MDLFLAVDVSQSLKEVVEAPSLMINVCKENLQRRGRGFSSYVNLYKYEYFYFQWASSLNIFYCFYF